MKTLKGQEAVEFSTSPIPQGQVRATLGHFDTRPAQPRVARFGWEAVGRVPHSPPVNEFTPPKIGGVGYTGPPNPMNRVTQSRRVARFGWEDGFFTPVDAPQLYYPRFWGTSEFSKPAERKHANPASGLPGPASD